MKMNEAFKRSTQRECWRAILIRYLYVELFRRTSQVIIIVCRDEMHFWRTGR